MLAPRATTTMIVLVAVLTCISLYILHSRKPVRRLEQKFVFLQKNCSTHFVMNSMYRSNVGYEYLLTTLRSIENLKNEFFTPCIVVFAIQHDQVNAIAQKASEINVPVQVQALPNAIDENSAFGSKSPLSAAKIKQAKDVYSALVHLSQHCGSPYDKIVFMEDDFEFCPNSIWHLLHVLSHVNAHKHSGARFSYGLNGVVLFCQDLKHITRRLYEEQHSEYPIDWLVEVVLYGMERPFLTYRYQLMQHLGRVSTIGNVHNDDQFPACLETLHSASTAYEFEVYKCAHSMFSPCEPGKEMRNFVPPNQFVSVQHPMHAHSLQQIASIKPVKCDMGQDCHSCCGKQNLKCKNENFIYINDCDLLIQQFGCQGCTLDNARPQSAPTAPRFDDYYKCVVAARPSRMRCETFKVTDARLCPCSEFE